MKHNNTGPHPIHATANTRQPAHDRQTGAKLSTTHRRVIRPPPGARAATSKFGCFPDVLRAFWKCAVAHQRRAGGGGRGQSEHHEDQRDGQFHQQEYRARQGERRAQVRPLPASQPPHARPPIERRIQHPCRRLRCRTANEGFKQLRIKYRGLQQVIQVATPSMDRAPWPAIVINQPPPHAPAMPPCLPCLRVCALACDILCASLLQRNKARKKERKARKNGTHVLLTGSESGKCDRPPPPSSSSHGGRALSSQLAPPSSALSWQAPAHFTQAALRAAA